MKKLLFSLLITSSTTFVPSEIVSLNDSQNIVKNEDKDSLSDFSVDKYMASLSHNMTQDEKLEKIIHDGINGVSDSEYRSEYGFFDQMYIEQPQQFMIRFNTCDLNHEVDESCSLTVYSTITNAYFQGSVDLTFDTRYQSDINWHILDQSKIALTLNTDKLDLSYDDLLKQTDKIKTLVLDLIKNFVNKEVLSPQSVEAFEKLDWIVTIPNSIIKDSSSVGNIYNIENINFKAYANQFYSQAEFSINLAVALNRDNLKFNVPYGSELSASANWSNTNDAYAESGWKNIVQLDDINEQANFAINKFKHIKINYESDYIYRDYNNVIQGIFDSKVLDESDLISKVVSTGKIAESIIVNDGAHSGLAYWQVLSKIQLKFEDGFLKINFIDYVKIKIISGSSHTSRLSYKVSSVELTS